jgi:hypothetical protein
MKLLTSPLPHTMTIKCIDRVKATLVLDLSQEMIPLTTKGWEKKHTHAQ